MTGITRSLGLLQSSCETYEAYIAENVQEICEAPILTQMEKDLKSQDLDAYQGNKFLNFFRWNSAGDDQKKNETIAGLTSLLHQVGLLINERTQVSRIRNEFRASELPHSMEAASQLMRRVVNSIFPEGDLIECEPQFQKAINTRNALDNIHCRCKAAREKANTVADVYFNRCGAFLFDLNKAVSDFGMANGPVRGGFPKLVDDMVPQFNLDNYPELQKALGAIGVSSLELDNAQPIVISAIKPNMAQTEMEIARILLSYREAYQELGQLRENYEREVELLRARLPSIDEEPV